MATTKRAFGVFQDGDSLRIVSLLQSRNGVKIERFYRDTLSVGESPQVTSGGAFDYSAYDNPAVTDNDYGTGMGNEVEFEEIDGVQDEFSGMTSLDNLVHIANEVNLEAGPLALNLEVYNVKYRKLQLSPKTSKKKMREALKKEFLVPGVTTYLSTSWVPCGPEEIIGIAHEGSMDLLERFVSINETSFHNALHIDRIHPNEVALINAVRFNYEITDDDFVAIFYVGVDYSRITLMNGTNFYMELPIINEGYTAENIINTIYSRYLLEKAQYHIPPLTRIFLAGSGIDSNALEMLVEKDPDVKVEILLPLHIMDNPDFENEYTQQELTEFIIPIMLATAVLYPRSDRLLQPDLLPKELKQKSMSIGFTGLILLTLTLATLLIGMQTLFKQKAENRDLRQSIESERAKIEENRAKIEMINGLKAQITELENNLARVKNLIGDKDQWHYVMEVVSNTFGDERLTWGVNLMKEGKGFRLKGTTTNRKLIVDFSQMFPDGKIDKINGHTLQGRSVWDFEVLFSMPDPLDTKKRDFLMNDFPIPTFSGDTQDEPTTDENPSVAPAPAKSSPTPAPAPAPKASKPAVAKTTPPAPSASTDAPSNDRVGPKPADAELYYDALDCYRANRLNDAITKFKQYAAENRDSYRVNATYFVGECYYQLGNFNEAMAYFEQVIGQGKAKMPEALLLAGKIAANQGNTEKAAVYWNRLVSDYPDSEYATMAKNKLARLGK